VTNKDREDQAIFDVAAAEEKEASVFAQNNITAFQWT
jgi:hypothetical protein